MDISEKCQICKQSSDQMLMLACIHDPCINCAASAYAELVHIKNNDPNSYICQVCGQETALDYSTVGELNNLSKSYVKVASPPRGNKSKGVGSSTTIQATPKKRQVVVDKRSAYFCKIHSEEQLTYYCYTCHENICPQCAIHGAHKDHQVKLIKKAINEAKSQYVDVVSQIGAAQNNMNKFKDGFNRAIKEAHERNTREKALVNQQFDNLRNALLVKERQIIKDLDTIHKENVMILTGFIENVNKVYEEVEKTKKQIENILRKDQVMIFEQFKHIPRFEEHTAINRKQSEDIAGQNLHLNSQFLQQELKNINEFVKALKMNSKKQAVGSQVILGKGSSQSHT